MTKTVYFFYDLETSGRTPEYDVLTLCGLIASPEMEILDKVDLSIQTRQNPPLFEVGALAINGICLETHNASAMPLEVARNYLDGFLSKYSKDGFKIHSAGWNNYWDNNMLEKCLLPNMWEHYQRHCLDVASIVLTLKNLGFFPMSLPMSLTKISEYLNISLENSHNAEADILATIEIYKICMEYIDGTRMTPTKIRAVDFKQVNKDKERDRLRSST